METNGADVIAYKDNEKYVIQVKFYNNPVGNKAVQEVTGAIGMYNASKGIVVTNSTFTNSATELANANNIELVDRNKLEILKKTVLNNIASGSSNVENKIMNKVKQINDRFPNMDFIKKYALAFSELTNYGYNDYEGINIVLDIMYRKNETPLQKDELKTNLEIEININHIKYAYEFFKNSQDNSAINNLSLMNQYIYAYFVAYPEEEWYSAEGVVALKNILEDMQLIEKGTETIEHLVNEMEKLQEYLFSDSSDTTESDDYNEFDYSLDNDFDDIF